MKHPIAIIKSTRAFLLNTIADLTLDELNEVPTGFNNNIIWNLGHMIAAQQSICYVRAGLPPRVDETFLAAYRPGTRPEGRVDEAGVAQIKNLLLTTLDDLEQDHVNGLWQQYPAWSTRYGITLDSIESAVSFLPFHEGLHSGYIMAQKRLVKPTLIKF